MGLVRSDHQSRVEKCVNSDRSIAKLRNLKEGEQVVVPICSKLGGVGPEKFVVSHSAATSTAPKPNSGSRTPSVGGACDVLRTR